MSVPLTRQDQMNVRNASHQRTKSVVALTLTFVAGFVDIAGVITVYDVFTAHMTGTTVRLGEHLTQRDWAGIVVTACVLGAFVSGSIVGRIIVEIGARRALRSIASVTLTLEAAFLAAVILLGNTSVGSVTHRSLAAVCVLLALLAGAMGLQTATLTRIGALTIHTTFVTGMLNKLAQLLSHWLFRSYDVRHAAGSRKLELINQRRTAGRQARFLFSIWSLYLAGAVVGTWLTYRLSFKSLVIPCLIILGAVVVDEMRPLSIEEERDESER